MTQLKLEILKISWMGVSGPLRIYYYCQCELVQFFLVSQSIYFLDSEVQKYLYLCMKICIFSYEAGIKHMLHSVCQGPCYRQWEYMTFPLKEFKTDGRKQNQLIPR